MNEQGRATREIIKAAQNTTQVASQVRAAATQQAVAVKQVAQAVESMRRGAATTSRALEEQAKASEQVSRESQNLARQIAGVSKAMSEQAVAATQVAATTRSMSRQSDQVAKGAAEQARAARDMTTSIESISKDVGSITRSNRVHLDSSSKVLNAISEIRQVTTHNAASAKSLSGGASGLGDRAERLAELMNNMEAGNRSNGNPTGRKKAKKAGSLEGV